MAQKTIGIFGSYATRPGEALYRLAYTIGHALGTAGFAVLNGGYDGIMRASSQGAWEAGARTIGVTCPTVLRKRGAALRPNEFLVEIYEAPTLLTRIEAMMRACGGYVFLEGGTGTLSELGVIWEYVNKGFIRPRPIVLVGHYWADLAARIAAAREGADRHVLRVQSPETVVLMMSQHALGTRAALHLNRLAKRETPELLTTDSDSP
ncbi:MAG: LOG family protein [Planctomycetota bacterium]